MPTCPVCKAGIGKDKVIPVYSRGQERRDPRYEWRGRQPFRQHSLSLGSLTL